MRRPMFATMSLASIGMSVAVLAAPAQAATTYCSATTNVGHGYSLRACITVTSGLVNEGGTVIDPLTNPRVYWCEINTRIVDSTTGESYTYAGEDTIPQCTANANLHRAYKPNAATMETAQCQPGHLYYVWIAITYDDL